MKSNQVYLKNHELCVKTPTYLIGIGVKKLQLKTVLF